MKQQDLTTRFCQKPENFAWFLGAGASRSCGLPTATDILWDLKRRYYCREENQEISRQDAQHEFVQRKLQDYMESRDFPKLWSDAEYSAYFERIFGQNKELQRQYLRKVLSEENLTLQIGNRVFSAFLFSGLTRVAFTTNFDNVVETAIAYVADYSLSAYHLEGAQNALNALNNEEFPFYCKLHGDFRYDSIKNLAADLAQQDQKLSDCFIAAASRFGFIVSGYSGRDESVMRLFHRALSSPNAFPHGLFWTGLQGSSPPAAVSSLLETAREKGVDAHYVEAGTFDSLMLRLWRNTSDKPQHLASKVRATAPVAVSIPLPEPGNNPPLIRLNALPILKRPERCLSLSFRVPKDLEYIRNSQRNAETRFVVAKASSVFAWGREKEILTAFKDDLELISPYQLPESLATPTGLQLKGFMCEALGVALAKRSKLLTRARRASTFLIVDAHEKNAPVGPLVETVEVSNGLIKGAFTEPTTEHPKSEQIRWAEALELSLDERNGVLWLLLQPDIWIWPPRGRSLVTDFLDERRADRFNMKHNSILQAWIDVLFGLEPDAQALTISAFEDEPEPQNPIFEIGRRTAFAKGRQS